MSLEKPPKKNENFQLPSLSEIDKILSQALFTEEKTTSGGQVKNLVPKLRFLKRKEGVISEYQERRIRKLQKEKEGLAILYENIQSVLNNKEIRGRIYFSIQELELLERIGIIDKDYKSKILELYNLFKNTEQKKYIHPDEKRKLETIERLLDQITKALIGLIISRKEEIRALIEEEAKERYLQIEQKLEQIISLYKKRLQKVKSEKENLPEGVDKALILNRNENKALFFDGIKTLIQSIKDLHNTSFERMIQILGPERIIKLMGREQILNILGISDKTELSEDLNQKLAHLLKRKSKDNAYNNLVEAFKNSVVSSILSQDHRVRQSTIDVLENSLKESIIYETTEKRIKNPFSDKEPLVPWHIGSPYFLLFNFFEKLSDIISEDKNGNIKFNIIKLRNLIRTTKRNVLFAETLIDQLSKGARPQSIDDIKQMVGAKVIPQGFKFKEGESPKEIIYYLNSFFGFKKQKDFLGCLETLYNSGIDDSDDSNLQEFKNDLKPIIYFLHQLKRENSVLQLLFGRKTGKVFWEALQEREENDKTGKTAQLLKQRKEAEARSLWYKEESERLMRQAEERGDIFFRFNHPISLEDKKINIAIGVYITKEEGGFKIVKVISPDLPEFVSRTGIREGQFYTASSIPEWLKFHLENKKQ